MTISRNDSPGTDDNPDLDVLAIGEALIDFISTETVGSLREATTFRRYLGGSPVNIAVNVSKLGGRAAVISKIGTGVFGQFVKEELASHDVNAEYLIMDQRVHTSIVFVSQTSGTPDYQPTRNSDYMLTPEELPVEAVARAKIVHTSTWPLSRTPSRLAVEKALKLASELGKVVSFDPNYSPIVWPNYTKAKKVMGDIYKYVTITKASLDDSHRFFGSGHRAEEYIEMFHGLGPKTVVLTMGKEGSLISEDGHLLGHVPARPVAVVDATGAGDSFWAGFLMAMLDGHKPERCLLFAREIVEIKLGSVGSLPSTIDRQEIYARLPNTVGRN